MTITQVHVRKTALTDAVLAEMPLAPLADGAVRLAVESFSVTANNVTYAMAGDSFKYWDFFPAPDPWLWLTFLGTWITMMLGSIPQQDVFQRITSARTAKIAIWGSVLGGVRVEHTKSASSGFYTEFDGSGRGPGGGPGGKPGIGAVIGPLPG